MNKEKLKSDIQRLQVSFNTIQKLQKKGDIEEVCFSMYRLCNEIIKDLED